MVARLLLLGEPPELVEAVETSALFFSSLFLPVLFLPPGRTEADEVATTSWESGAGLGVDAEMKERVEEPVT